MYFSNSEKHRKIEGYFVSIYAMHLKFLVEVVKNFLNMLNSKQEVSTST